MKTVSEVFQLVATTLGSCGLILGAYALVSSKPVSTRIYFFFVAAGILLFFLVLFQDLGTIRRQLPVAAMFMMIIFGLVAIPAGKAGVGYWLLLGVGLSAAAQWSLGNMPSQAMGIDVFHYVLAGSLVCFALAGRSASWSGA
ncbi:MAG TPA: hypothetical protein DCF63_19065 [Planctomycetaceae bacterium]|nr:hypothetical protein [Planctomycetaceae bacterium]